MHKLFFIFFLFLMACSPKPDRNLPDVSQISDQIEFIHTDRMLFDSDSVQLVKNWENLSRDHNAFFSLYLNQIIQLNDSLDLQDPALLNRFIALRNDSSFVSLNALIHATYKNRDDIEKECKEVIRYVRHYFPETALRRIYFLISEFSVGSFIFQDSDSTDALGIGLDFYLGNAVYYKSIDPQNPAFSDYLSRSFNKDHIIKKTWEVWADDHLPPLDGSRFLDQMIREGKKLWLLSKIIPNIQDSVLFEFSDAQMKWCRQNQVEMWSFFLDQQLLYSTEFQKFNKYIRPSPNSPGMPGEAPGRTGAYIGFQILKAFEKRQGIVDLQSLLDEPDAGAILEKSRFKPRND